MSRGLVLTIILILLVVVGFYFLIQDQTIIDPQSKVGSNILAASPTPTPMPLLELTIPYLRAREYKSNLGELERYADNANYTSYLTSYDSDGLNVNGLLTIPKPDSSALPQNDNNKYPAIIFIHGYIPPQNYRTTQNYADYVDYLARNGFVVFKIDLRGHGTSEGEPGGGYYSADYVIDALNARAALQNSEFVNPESIGFWGHSMSGNVVMRTFAAKPEIPAVVIWAGAGYTYFDLREYGISDSSYQPLPSTTPRPNHRQQILDIHGPPTKESEFWKLMTPTNYLNDLKGAVQLNHAVDDNVVSIDYSRNLNSLLDQTSVSHQLNEYPNGGHNITGNSFNQAMQKTVDFFKENLK